MSYVTEDPRVRVIVDKMRAGTLTRAAARAAILDIAPGKKGDRIGGSSRRSAVLLEKDEALPPRWLRPGRLFLEWEADEAIRSGA